MTAYRLETTYACALIFVDGQGKIVDTANIYRFMMGKKLEDMARYLKRKEQYVSMIRID